MKNFKKKRPSFTVNINNLKKEKDRKKYSKSQKTLKLNPNELINNFDSYIELTDLNNLFTNSENYHSKKLDERNNNFYLNNTQFSSVYAEEINYNIDATNKNFHDTTDSSKIKKENEYINNNSYITKTSEQKEYLIEEKNRYIQELEKKIQAQENSINNLLNYKKKIEAKLLENKNNNFSSLENNLIYDYSNKKMVKKLNREENKINDYKHKSYKEINLNKNGKNFTDKYNILYSKYLQLNNDFKFLNSNNKNYKTQINNIQDKYDKIEKEYKILKNLLEEKNEIIEKQKIEINEIKNKENNKNCQIQYIIGGEEEKEVIKNLKQQVEIFRKDLVLSQAMVNSLKSEIEHLTKIKNSNNDLNNSFDKYVITFNNNNSKSPISQNNIYYNHNMEDNPKNLLISLNNKNQLLTKVLAENNELRNKLKKFDSFPSSEFIIDVDYNEKREEEMNKKLVKKYEDKFIYFNNYY